MGWSKLYLFPKYWVQISDGEAKGKRYNGIVNYDYNRPDIMGIMEMEKDLYHVGEFHNGVLEGRGYALKREEWEEEETYTTRGTYEEVMETAQFDSCGRVIYCEPVFHTHKTKTKRERWIISEDGIWKNGKLRNETPKTILSSEWWKDAQLGFTRLENYDKHPSGGARHKSNLLSAMNEEHLLELEDHVLLTPFDNLSLLVLEHAGVAFQLEIGKDFVLSRRDYPGKAEERIFTFSLGPDYKRYVDLQVREWKAGRSIQPVAMAAEYLYTRALNSLIYLCCREYKPSPEAFAHAIVKEVPEARIVNTRPDGTHVIVMPGNEVWTICAQHDHTWLYSSVAKDRIRLSERKPDDVAKVAAQAQEIWKYCNASLS